MRIQKLYWLIALLAAPLLGVGCQTAQRSEAILPAPQANAPALTQAMAPAPPSARSSEAAPSVISKVDLPKAEAPKADPVAELVAKAEKEFQTGKDNYAAGHLDAARKNFDNAFNLLLSSPEAEHPDPRLQAEFDHVLEGVNELDLPDSQLGETSAEQKSEPAPIDETNELTPAVDPSIKAKAEAEVKATHSDLPLMLTDPVAGYISYFSGRGRGILERGLARSGRYRDMIEHTLKQEGVPQDLIYLAQAESGFHPLALSRAGARGMWQFMGSRAKGYGLQRDYWVDDRQDPEKATRAAAHHLKDLFNQFGDWYLAMAAYNSGPGTVQAAVKRTGYADFWELYRRNVLPKETRNYVPIIVAVTIMAKNPAQYGLDTVDLDKPIPFDIVKIDYPVDLRLVAECVDVSTSDLQDLNPSLLRMVTPKERDFELRLPAGSRERYLSAIASIPPDMRVWWRYHTVTSGETLASVARSYHLTTQALAKANHLEDGEVETSSKLIIPLAPGKHVPGEESYSRILTRYRVRKGDTVQKVADNFGVSPTMVRRWNHLKGDSVAGRRVLYIHLPVTPNANELRRASTSKPKSSKTLRKTSGKPVSHHTVKAGETLTSIATTHHTTVAAIKRDNGNLATLRPGMILVIRDIK